MAVKGTKLTAAALGTLLGVLAFYEGSSLTAYHDPVGIPTICEGWTHGVKPGDVATPEQCEELTLEGIRQADRILSHYVPDFPDAPEMRAAYLSFIYNVGVGGKGVKDGFVYLNNGGHSTMFRLLKDGNYELACKEFPKWTKAGGRVLNGLVKRRQAEMELCNEGLRLYRNRSNSVPERVEDTRLALVEYSSLFRVEHCEREEWGASQLTQARTGVSG